MSTTQPIGKSLITDAFVVAASTAFLYLVAFFYEWGYCYHYSIPIGLITPNTATVLVAAAAIGTFLVTSVQLFGIALPLLRVGLQPNQTQRPYREVLLLNAIVLVLGVVLIRAYGISLSGLLQFLFGSILLNFLFFGIGLLAHRKKPTVADRLTTISAERKDDVFDAWAWIEEIIGRRQMLSFIAVISFLGIAFIIGNGEATRQQRFLMLTDHSGFAVLRVYGDQILAGQVDSRDRKAGSGLLLIKLSADKPLRMQSEDIGPIVGLSPIEPGRKASSPVLGASSSSLISSKAASASASR